MAWKGFYTKDFRWGICFEIFPKTAKEFDTKDHVYQTGFHHWLSDFDSRRHFSVVIGTFRIILMTPTRKKVWCIKGEGE